MISSNDKPAVPAEALPENKMNIGEELRDHDLPQPEQPPRRTTSPVAEYETMPVGGTRQGGKVKDGDIATRGEVPTVFDQDASTPDLVQEIG